MNLLQKINNDYLNEVKENSDIEEFKAGDTIKVHLKVIEGTRERIQIFEGVCIAKTNDGINSSFIVRKLSSGEGVEKNLPLFSPKVAKVEVVKYGLVRRAKLYYLRGLTGKASRIKEDLVKANSIRAAKKKK